MVSTTVDPIRMPTVTLSQSEMEEIEGLIEAGQLPKDFLDRYFDAVENNVFGVDHKKDRHGNPVEQGIGSPGNMTQNSINAYKRYAKYDPDFDEAKFAENIKRMEADLKASNERRAVNNPNTRRRKRRVA